MTAPQRFMVTCPSCGGDLTRVATSTADGSPAVCRGCGSVVVVEVSIKVLGELPVEVDVQRPRWDRTAPFAKLVDDLMVAEDEERVGRVQEAGRVAS